MDRRKVLVVDDDPGGCVHELFRRRLGKDVILLDAWTLEEGRELFNANPDVSVVVMDACVGGKSPNSQELVREIHRTSFELPIIAISEQEKYRQELVSAGCSAECEKQSCPQMVRKLLDLE